MRKCPYCDQRHRRGFASCRVAKDAEQGGAQVAWANDPDDMQHLITFTPETLAVYVNGKTNAILRKDKP